MNVKRFTARTSREALRQVKEAFGEDAVVLSNKPTADGVEVLAMAPEGMDHIASVASRAPAYKSPRTPEEEAPAAPLHAALQAKPVSTLPINAKPGSKPPAKVPAKPAAAASPVRAESAQDLLRSRANQLMQASAQSARQVAAAKPMQLGERIEPQLEPYNPGASVEHDVEQLAMSTLSFQDYVRERMLRRRQQELSGGLAHEANGAPQLPPDDGKVVSVLARRAAAIEAARANEAAERTRRAEAAEAAEREAQRQATMRREPPVLRDEVHLPPSLPAAAPQRPLTHVPAIAPMLAEVGVSRRDQQDMMSELRSMKGLIEQRFGALAFMEKLQRHPAQAHLTQKLLDAGYSPGLVRKLVESLPAQVTDEIAWAGSVLERNVITGEQELALEDQGGVFAMVGATGVGKTTSTAKLAAAFATKHGAANLGLITLDAYRVGAHEQLRTYGRILGVPVHTAHDRASLEDLLELLSSKKMVLIDTAGIAQRDARTRELLGMLVHPSIQKLLVVNAAAQGETIEDVVLAYRANECKGVVLSKIDEAVKLGPALDTLIRYKLKVLGVANGQRVPEDWHRLSSQALVQRAMRATSGPAWHMDASDVNLIFAASEGPMVPSPLQQRPMGPAA